MATFEKRDSTAFRLSKTMRVAGQSQEYLVSVMRSTRHDSCTIALALSHNFTISAQDGGEGCICHFERSATGEQFMTCLMGAQSKKSRQSLLYHAASGNSPMLSGENALDRIYAAGILGMFRLRAIEHRK